MRIKYKINKKDDNDVAQEALARHDKNPRTRARDDMDMERLLKVFLMITVIY